MADTLPATTSPALPEIIARYAAGESLTALAAECQVNRSTIYRWMLSEVGEGHEELITQCLVNRVAEADGMLESASDACNVTRAREIARFARMDLERRRPSLYGQKSEVKLDASITVHVVRLAELEVPAIEGKALVISDADPAGSGVTPQE